MSPANEPDVLIAEDVGAEGGIADSYAESLRQLSHRQRKGGTLGDGGVLANTRRYALLYSAAF
jgi:hypothetical protein